MDLARICLASRIIGTEASGNTKNAQKASHGLSHTATATNPVYGGVFAASFTTLSPVYGGATLVQGIQLMEPLHTFEPRLNQVDVRLAKTVKIARMSVQGMFDVYNLFNASSILLINTTYGPNWLRPSNILGARLFKLGAQINF